MKCGRKPCRRPKHPSEHQKVFEFVDSDDLQVNKHARMPFVMRSLKEHVRSARDQRFLVENVRTPHKQGIRIYADACEHLLLDIKARRAVVELFLNPRKRQTNSANVVFRSHPGILPRNGPEAKPLSSRRR